MTFGKDNSIVTENRPVAARGYRWGQSVTIKGSMRGFGGVMEILYILMIAIAVT